MSALKVEAPPRPLARAHLDTSTDHPTPAERAALGAQARAEVPREVARGVQSPPDRPDPIDPARGAGRARVPELVPIRYGRMMVSPFTSIRGAALPMATDLATTPVSGLTVQACGDAHLSNFGVFGSAERQPGLRRQRLRRDAAGPVGVGRQAAGRQPGGRRRGQRVHAASSAARSSRATVARYRQAMRDFAGMSNLDIWYAHADIDQLRAQFNRQLKARQRKLVAKGAGQGPHPGQHAGTGQADHDGGRPGADHQRPAAAGADRGPGIRPAQRSRVRVARSTEHDRQVPAHTRDRPAAPARAVSSSCTWPARSSASAASGRGAGSRCCSGATALTRCSSRSRRPRTSVLSRFLGASEYTNQGQRVVAGQRLMQASSDIFLGWQRVRRASTASSATSTSASCATGSSPSTSTPWCRRWHAHVRRAVRLDPGARPRPVR